jgi:hypothetical protein
MNTEEHDTLPDAYPAGARDASPAAARPPRTLRLYAPSCASEDLPSILRAQATERMADMPDMPDDFGVRAFEAIDDSAELARSMGDGEADVDITETTDGKFFVHVNHHESGTAHGRYAGAKLADRDVETRDTPAVRRR